ncbi:MAG: transporter substrate-binding domain-containing protein [Phycisphaerae bacterium]
MSAFRSLAVALFAASAVVCAAGCSKSNSEDALAKVKREGVLKWGADPSGGAPFVFYDPADTKKVIGFEIDVMDKLAAHMGVRHEMVSCDWDALIDNLRAKRTDMVMNGIEVNDARKEQVGFTAPYYIYEQQITVRQEDKETYKSLNDLKGHKIATLKAAEANNVLKQAGFPDDLICPLPDSETPYRELELKRVDAVLQEGIIAAYYASPERASKLYNVPATFSPGKYAVAVRKEDTALLAEIDRALELMKRNGELAEIYKRWGIWNGRQKDVGISEKAP